MSLIKSAAEIGILRQGGAKLATVLRAAVQEAVPGVQLLELDKKIEAHIRSLDAKPSFLGFEGYPYASCLSLNSQVVHGIPDQRVLQDGDILGIDVGLWFKDLCVDSAVTVAIGTASAADAALLKDTQDALAVGIAAVKPQRRVGVISHAIEQLAEERGRGIVRVLTGHGVGHHVHEDPAIPNYGHSSDGILLRPGMVLAIEPMLTAGSGEVLTQIDGWGIITADNSMAAQFEHTVVVTSRGAEIITH